MPATPDPREPLLRYLEAQQISDSEMRVLLRDSASEAARIAAAAGSGVGGDMRRAQLDIAQSQQKMWEKVGYQAQIDIGDGVDAAANSAAFTMETMLDSMGVGTVGMNQAMLMQGRQGIESLVSKRENAIPLSQQVYKTSVASGEQLDRTINAMIINGSSAREIADRVKGFIDPATPGGASYAAMRLGRTELNNAFHATSIRLNKDNPFVEAMKWNLSGSHPKPDACNQYADDVHMKNGDEGVYEIGDIPPKPHPQCLCYITPEVVSDADFVKNYKAGQYNDYLDNQLGVGRVGSGIIPDIMGSDVTHTMARDMFKQVRKEMPGLQDSAYRREAARRLDMELKDYTKIWKNPGKIKVPIEPAPVLPPVNPIIRPPVTPMPKPPIAPNIPIPAPVEKLTHEAARAEYNVLKKEMPGATDAEVRREAAKVFNVPYKEYLDAWKKPTNPKLTPYPPGIPKVPSVIDSTKGWQLKPVNQRALTGEPTSLTVGHDIKEVNKHFNSGNPDWRNNCPSATSSFEMRQRGYDVVANPMANGAQISKIYEAWGIKIEDQIGVPRYLANELKRLYPSNGRMDTLLRNRAQTIRQDMITFHTSRLPNGARGFISVSWKTSGSVREGGAHIFNWVKIDGRIEYFDGQTGKALGNGRSYLSKAKDDVYMARVDQLSTPTKAKLDWLAVDRHSGIALRRDAEVAKRKAETSAERYKRIQESNANRLAREKYQREAAARRQAHKDRFI